LIVVKPDTVVSWHRKGWITYWRWRPHRSLGRRAPCANVREISRNPATHLESKLILGGLHHVYQWAAKQRLSSYCALQVAQHGAIKEVFVKVNDIRHYLWRAVDQDGEIVDVFLQHRRDGPITQSSSASLSCSDINLSIPAESVA